MKTYGVLKLTEASPGQAFTEPLSLEDAKIFLKINEGEVDEDDMISALITAAREVAETYQGRDLVEKQWDLTLDGFLECEIALRDNLQTVDLVRYRDVDGNYTTMTPTTQYIVDPARGIVTTPSNVSWPTFDAWPTGAVLVRFTCGPESVPKHVVAGMQMLIAQWYENREAANSGSLTEVPFGVKMLLEMGAKNAVA